MAQPKGRVGETLKFYRLGTNRVGKAKTLKDFQSQALKFHEGGWGETLKDFQSQALKIHEGGGARGVKCVCVGVSVVCYKYKAVNVS